MDTTPQLDLYEIACLAGGLPRVVDTALVTLVQSGRVRVTSPGELATVSLVRAGTPSRPPFSTRSARPVTGRPRPSAGG